MLSTDRADFEAQLAVLFGGFPTFLTPPRIEAYWRGLAKMPLSLFVRCVDQALGEAGTEKLPTVSTLWQISKRLRVPAPPQREATEARIHPLQAAANSALLSLLRDKGPASEDCIKQLISLKNQIVGSIPAESDPTEVRDVLLAAFEKRWAPMPDSERTAVFEKFEQVGHV